MYIEKPEREHPLPVPKTLGLAIAVCLIGVVGMGAYPAPWVEVAERVAASLFS
jgi:hypothetical protein